MLMIAVSHVIGRDLIIQLATQKGEFTEVCDTILLKYILLDF